MTPSIKTPDRTEMVGDHPRVVRVHTCLITRPHQCGRRPIASGPVSESIQTPHLIDGVHCMNRFRHRTESNGSATFSEGSVDHFGRNFDRTGGVADCTREIVVLPGRSFDHARRVLRPQRIGQRPDRYGQRPNGYGHVTYSKRPANRSMAASEHLRSEIQSPFTVLSQK